MAQFRTMESLLHEFRSLVDRFSRLRRRHSAPEGRAGEEEYGWLWRPAVDAVDAGEEVILALDLPGVDKKAIEVRVEGDTLVVEGRRRPTIEGRPLLQERDYGAFRRAFVLPPIVEADGIRARYENGVLRLSLPKAAASRPRRVDVKAA